MSSSLDRKIEAARARAAAEARTKGQTADQFAKDNHLPDGTVGTGLRTASAPAAPTAPYPKVWVHDSPGWHEANKPDVVYDTAGDGQPNATMSNVTGSRTTIGKTHIDKAAPAVSPAKDPLMQPKRQVHIGLAPRHQVAEQRLRDIDQAIVRFTQAGQSIPAEWEAERLELVEYTRTSEGELPLHSAMRVLTHAVQTDPDYARHWHGEVVEAVHEQLGGRDQPNCIDNAILIAAQFMHKVFGVALDSELNKLTERKPEPEPVAIGFPRGAELALDMVNECRKQLDLACGVDPAHGPDAMAMMISTPRHQGRSCYEQMFHEHMKRVKAQAFQRAWAQEQPNAELPSGNFGQRTPEAATGQTQQTIQGANHGKTRTQTGQDADQVHAAHQAHARRQEQITQQGLNFRHWPSWADVDPNDPRT